MLKLFITKVHWNIRQIADFLTNIRILCAPYSPKNTVLHKYVLPITMIVSMISFFREKLLIKPVLCLKRYNF